MQECDACGLLFGGAEECPSCGRRVSHTAPENIEDEYAVELYFKETMIGHIPRSDNKHIFRLIEQGKDLVCTIREIDPDAETWQMCKVKVEMVAYHIYNTVRMKI